MQKRCPITYALLKETESLYSKKGLSQISPRLDILEDFPYSAQEQRERAQSLASKLSIQGVQPKLSASLNIGKKCFEIKEKGGTYIIKPQSADWQELPENEDVTMRMAKCIGLDTPFHGLIYSKDQSLSYIIQRFDRTKRGEKYALEDFAQLSYQSRETKYKSSMEKVAKIIETFTTFPSVEKETLFRMTLFSFIVGNEDMHLKNFSLITKKNKITLSPMYDLLNSSIALKNPQEEMALPIRGKRRKLNKDDLLTYFAGHILNMNRKRIESILTDIAKHKESMKNLIQISFLSMSMKERYNDLLENRLNRLGL